MQFVDERDKSQREAKQNADQLEKLEAEFGTHRRHYETCLQQARAHSQSLEQSVRRRAARILRSFALLRSDRIVDAAGANTRV